MIAVTGATGNVGGELVAALSARDQQVRAVVLEGQSDKSLIGGADIKEMAGLDQPSAEACITTLRDLC